MVPITRARRVALSAAVAVFLLGCAADDDSANLSQAALDGRSVVRSKGCAACHGSNGDGGVGPTFVGLLGSEVQLQDGSTVVADRDYLVESIVEPAAKLVESYNLPMPDTELSTDEIDAVIAYIEALAVVDP
jgi:mono/diheme cytochrome c family protein